MSLDIISAKLRSISRSKRDMSRWKPLFMVFALVCMAVMMYTSGAVKRYSVLGGRKTVEAFYRTNLAGFAVMCLAVIGFVIVLKASFIGKSRTTAQVMMTAASGVIVLYCFVMLALATSNIRKDLKETRHSTLDKYVLCTDETERKYYIAFDDMGESLLLDISAEKYDYLKKGEIKEGVKSGRAYDLVVGDSYASYKNAELYCTPLEISYFQNSAILEKCTFKEKLINEN